MLDPLEKVIGYGERSLAAMQSLRWELCVGSHPLSPVGKTPTAFRRSEIRLKIFLDMRAIFMSPFLFSSPPPVLTAPSEPSVVGVVVTKAPGACAGKK